MLILSEFHSDLIIFECKFEFELWALLNRWKLQETPHPVHSKSSLLYMTDNRVFKELRNKDHWHDSLHISIAEIGNVYKGYNHDNGCMYVSISIGQQMYSFDE